MAKAKAGRKNKYHTHVQSRLFEIEHWCRDGLTEEEIAKRLGIAYSTFKKYKREFPALSAALKNGKAIADYHVEDALFKRAVGFYYDEAKEYLDENGIVVKSIKLKKYMPPDPVAAIFWLKNRKPKSWRNNPAETESVEDGLKALAAAIERSKRELEETKE